MVLDVSGMTRHASPLIGSPLTLSPSPSVRAPPVSGDTLGAALAEGGGMRAGYRFSIGTAGVALLSVVMVPSWDTKIFTRRGVLDSGIESSFSL